ncbi:hypothetical protein A2W32_00050, partial [candidate division WWE3 bacterium RBG_16_37_10]
MRSSLKHILVILFLSLISVILLLGLFSKYSIEVLAHFHEKCQEISSLIWPPNTHTIGLGVLIITVLSSIAVTFKTFFSFLKTKRKIENLLVHKLSVMPDKILHSKKIVEHLDSLVIVENNKCAAFSYGFYRPKMVLSTGLINSLNAKELEAVILHELHHLKYAHVPLIFIMEIIKSSLFFIPLLSVYIQRLRQNFEEEADKTVIKIQGSPEFLERAFDVFYSKNALNFRFVAPFSARFSKNSKKVGKRAVFSTFFILLVFIALYIYPTT